MADLSDTTTIVMSPDVRASALGSEYVLLNLQDGTYYGLDDVGGEVWKLVQTPVTIAEICSAIAAEYDVETDRCHRDILQLVHDLARREA
jgi:hypothetical protein